MNYLNILKNNTDDNFPKMIKSIKKRGRRREREMERKIKIEKEKKQQRKTNFCCGKIYV